MGEPAAPHDDPEHPEHPHGTPPGQDPDFVPPGHGGTPPGQDKRKNPTSRTRKRSPILSTLSSCRS